MSTAVVVVWSQKIVPVIPDQYASTVPRLKHSLRGETTNIAHYLEGTPSHVDSASYPNGDGLPVYTDNMPLLIILIGVGLVIGVVGAVLVYLDSVRRGLPAASCLVRAVACGGGSFGSFLVPHVFSQELQYVYFQVLKPRPIAVSPREWALVSLMIGFVSGVVFMGLYIVASRFRHSNQAKAQ